jgi:hypothetical protein
VVDKGYNRAVKAQKSLRGWKATIGVHTDGGSKADGIRNVDIAVVHEFGATINHPGGTPYTVFSGGGGRSGGMVGGAAIFLPKGSPNAIGLTRPHVIKIPQRSFLRTSFDANRLEYERILEQQTGRVIDGNQTARNAIAVVGEKALADVVNRINAGIPPPLKPATIARKGSSKPLIDTGQLKQSIKVKVRRS